MKTVKVFILASVLLPFACFAGEPCKQPGGCQKGLPSKAEKLEEALDKKLKLYDKNRGIKNFTDKYGMTWDRDLRMPSAVSQNPSLKDQLKKSHDFRKVNVGPVDDAKNQNLGIKLSIPIQNGN